MRRCILVKSESFGEGDCFSKRWMGMVERKREKDDGLRALRRRAEGVYEQQRLGSPWRSSSLTWVSASDR